MRGIRGCSAALREPLRATWSITRAYPRELGQIDAGRLASTGASADRWGMTSAQRLKRLREMIAQLERLPATPERDRMLREVRARLVDVDTGEPPRAFPAADVDSILADSLVARARKPRERRRPRTIQLPQPAKPVVEVAPSVEFEADVVLNFDDSPSFWPDEDDAAPTPAPWTRGLRG